MEAIKNFFKKTWDGIKNIKWFDTVKPVIAYSVSGGVLALAIIIGVLVLCL